MPGMTKDEIERAASKLGSGISIAKIANEMGFSEETISRSLQRLGYWEGRKPKFTKDQIETMIVMYWSGKSLQDISEALSTTYNEVYPVLARMGIKPATPMRDLPSQQRMLSLFSHDISETWWAEFRGLFYGEGTINLNGSGGKLSVQVRILLRDDDYLVLKEIRDMLGGTLSHYIPKASTTRPNNNPSWTWVSSGLSRCYPILKKLSAGALSARKRQDIDLAIEFCEWRLSLPRALTQSQHEIQESFRTRLKEIRAYKAY